MAGSTEPVLVATAPQPGSIQKAHGNVLNQTSHQGNESQIYIYIYSVFYPFICSRTPRLFPYLFQINATISTGVKMLL